jgi:hypothetical protein
MKNKLCFTPIVVLVATITANMSTVLPKPVHVDTAQDAQKPLPDTPKQPHQILQNPFVLMRADSVSALHWRNATLINPTHDTGSITLLTNGAWVPNKNKMCKILQDQRLYEKAGITSLKANLRFV